MANFKKEDLRQIAAGGRTRQYGQRGSTSVWSFRFCWIAKQQAFVFGSGTVGWLASFTWNKPLACDPDLARKFILLSRHKTIYANAFTAWAAKEKRWVRTVGDKKIIWIRHADQSMSGRSITVPNSLTVKLVNSDGSVVMLRFNKKLFDNLKYNLGRMTPMIIRNIFRT